MYKIEDVESVSYDFEKSIMTISLNKYIVYKKINTKEIRYKASYEKFINTSCKFINFKNKILK